MTTMIPEIYAALIELGAPEEMAWSAAETLIRQLPADKVAMLRECALRRMVEDQLSDLRYACQGHSIEWPAELDKFFPKRPPSRRLPRLKPRGATESRQSKVFARAQRMTAAKRPNSVSSGRVARRQRHNESGL